MKTILSLYFTKRSMYVNFFSSRTNKYINGIPKYPNFSIKKLHLCCSSGLTNLAPAKDQKNLTGISRLHVGQPCCSILNIFIYLKSLRCVVKFCNVSFCVLLLHSEKYFLLYTLQIFIRCAFVITPRWIETLIVLMLFNYNEIRELAPRRFCSEEF